MRSVFMTKCGLINYISNSVIKDKRLRWLPYSFFLFKYALLKHSPKLYKFFKQLSNFLRIRHIFKITLSTRYVMNSLTPNFCKHQCSFKKNWNTSLLFPFTKAQFNVLRYLTLERSLIYNQLERPFDIDSNNHHQLPLPKQILLIC